VILLRDFHLRVGLFLVILFLLPSRVTVSSEHVAQAQPGTREPDALWFMRRTAMDALGRLTFFDKPWWPQARQLREGR
jgi:hypothetical protein